MSCYGADDAAVMPLKLPLKRWACDEKINWHAPCGFSSIFWRLKVDTEHETKKPIYIMAMAEKILDL